MLPSAPAYRMSGMANRGQHMPSERSAMKESGLDRLCRWFTLTRSLRRCQAHMSRSVLLVSGPLHRKGAGFSGKVWIQGRLKTEAGCNGHERHFLPETEFEQCKA